MTGDLLDGLEMKAVLADLFGRQQFGGLAVMFAQLADTGVVSFSGATAEGQQLEIIGEGF